MLDRLRRVTTLFVEGTECYLGMDDDGDPVVLWVNKLNSFEVEESRADGLAARGLALMNLAKDDNPERAALSTLVDSWSVEQLLDALVEQKGEEMYLDILNELEGDEEWAEKLAILRRMPAILADENAANDDPRRKELYELQTAYLDALREARDKARAKIRREFADEPRAELERVYFENWRNRNSLDDFMAARRITELFYCIRDCQAQEEGRDATGRIRWSHAKCDHRRLLNERSQVRELPEQVLAKVTDTLEELTSTPRESGNSGAPQSSSESAERPSEPEDSTPSTPVETSPAVPTT